MCALSWAAAALFLSTLPTHFLKNPRTNIINGLVYRIASPLLMSKHQQTSVSPPYLLSFLAVLITTLSHYLPLSFPPPEGCITSSLCGHRNGVKHLVLWPCNRLDRFVSYGCGWYVLGYGMHFSGVPHQKVVTCSMLLTSLQLYLSMVSNEKCIELVKTAHISFPEGS